jgi:hypothetical protein
VERQQLLGEFRLKPLLAGLEIAHAGFHAFRHASATILSRMKVPMEIRRARMGHTDEEMTPRYTHVRRTRGKLRPLRSVPSARWCEPLTAEKMKQCLWVQPEIVAQIEFLERADRRGSSQALKVCRAARRQKTSNSSQREIKSLRRVPEGCV